MGTEEPMREMLERIVIASVGPTTSERLGFLGLRADLSEEEAYLSLRRQSRQTRSSMKDTAQAIIEQWSGLPGNDALS